MTLPKQLQPWAFKPQERAAAKEAGLTTYFTGRPCKNGHIVLRCTASGGCVECSKEMQKRTVQKRLALNPDWYKQKYAANPEKYKLITEKYRENNPEKVKETQNKWRMANKQKRSAATMRRHATKSQATPKWLNKAELDLINDYYAAARHHEKDMNIVLSVDHIVPLRGKTVCGLHVPWNLCLRTKSDNSKKHNKLTEDAYWPKQTGILVANSALPWNLKKETKNVNFN
jgi:hypothetical protein